jgi:hypothetical protein
MPVTGAVCQRGTTEQYCNGVQTVDESKVIALFVAAARRAALEPRED